MQIGAFGLPAKTSQNLNAYHARCARLANSSKTKLGKAPPGDTFSGLFKQGFCGLFLAFLAEQQPVQTPMMRILANFFGIADGGGSVDGKAVHCQKFFEREKYGVVIFKYQCRMLSGSS